MKNIILSLRFVFVLFFSISFSLTLKAEDLIPRLPPGGQSNPADQDIDFALLKKQLATMEETMHKLQATMEEAIKKQQEVIVTLKNKIESKERVVYNPVSNVEMSEFSRVTPKKNFSWGKGFGAIEVAARYSELDLTDKDIGGGRLNDITLGLNWYLNPNTRVMLNYVHTDVDLRDSNVSNGNADIFAMRFQVDL